MTPTTPNKKKFLKVPNMHMGAAFKEIGRNAYVDWILVLIVCFIVALALVSGGLYLYWQISSGNFKGTNTKTETPKKIFDENQLAEVVTKFKLREDAMIELKKGYAGPPDPSK